MFAFGIAGQCIATLVTVLPLAFAALVFANSFKTAKDASGALAFNLFGAVLGGLLEYVSTYTGIRSLLIISFVLYAASLLCYVLHEKTASPMEAVTPN